MKKNWKTKPGPLPPPDAETLRRLWARTVVSKGCWILNGAENGCGYNAPISVNNSRIKHGKMYYPHRLMFSWFKWDIPDGMTIDHLCKNRRCINPDHMEVVTGPENTRRGNKKPYCRRGHPQSDRNRYIYGNGRERCKPCIPIIQAAYRKKKSRK